MMVESSSSELLYKPIYHWEFTFSHFLWVPKISWPRFSSLVILKSLTQISYIHWRNPFDSFPINARSTIDLVLIHNPWMLLLLLLFFLLLFLTSLNKMLLHYCLDVTGSKQEIASLHARVRLCTFDPS